MYVAIIPNRGSPPAILLRESYREDGKPRNRTLANLSGWPGERIELLRAVLRGERLLPAADALQIVRALPHGHVLAAVTTARRIELDALLPRRAPQRRRDLAFALIIARLLDPAAKLATARMLDPATASHSLGEVLGLGSVTAGEVYATLDWLGGEQGFIEASLARRHLRNGTLLLYDVTSTYLEGRCCELARYGYSRDHRRDRPQLVIGLLCAADGCPVAVEVFEGNTADPATLSTQIDKLKRRFNLHRVVMVGDRGMLTEARINQTLRPAGLDWITALRAPAIKALAADDGPLQLSLFDDRDMAEITSPEYPGERLVVCRNPLLAAERARKRDELLAATEADLARIQTRVQRVRLPLRGAAEIGKVCGVWSAQGGQALHHDDHRWQLQLRQKPRRRGSAGWHLRAAHQSAHAVRRHGVRAGLQEPRRRRAGLPVNEDRRSGTASSIPLDRPAGARPRAALHARLLSRMAHASPPGTDFVRRARSRRTRCAAHFARRKGQTLAGSKPQSRQQAHRSDPRRDAAGAQLPHLARRSRNADTQPCPVRSRSPGNPPRRPNKTPAHSSQHARHHATRVARPTACKSSRFNALHSEISKVRLS